MNTFKKNLLVLSLFFGTFAFSQDVKVGKFKFEKEIIDYGMISQNSNGERNFVFKNIGNAPITIAKAKGSCGCTLVDSPKKSIFPNETAEIKVRYDTQRIGNFTKTITLTSNASTTHKILQIKGNVVQNKLTLK